MYESAAIVKWADRIQVRETYFLTVNRRFESTMYFSSLDSFIKPSLLRHLLH